MPTHFDDHKNIFAARWILIIFLAWIVTSCAPVETTTSPTSPVATTQVEPTSGLKENATEDTVKPSISSEGPLVVFEWSGYELIEFWQPFADKHPEVKVEFSFFAEDAEALAKLQSGFGVDVHHPCNSWIGQLAENKLIQPIDTSQLENWPLINPDLAKAGQYNGQQYMVPWDWGYESVLVRTDKVQEVPDAWADLWDTQYAGHVSFFDGGETAWVVAARVLGFDPYQTTPQQQAAIEQKLIELKPNLLNYWTDYTEIVQLVAAGDVWLAGAAWPDTLLLVREQGVEAEYIQPQEGRMGYVCGFSISANSKNLDLAYDYIDAAISTPSMANLVELYGYGPANTEALAQADQTFVGKLGLNDPNIFSTAYFYRPLTSELRQLMTDTWSKVKAAP
jgi:spermidine/putrescine-binding protein